MTLKKLIKISPRNLGTAYNPDGSLVKKFSYMLEDGRIQQIQNMYWPSRLLPELYIDARRNSYWLNIEKITDPIKLTGGAKIKLIKFGGSIPITESIHCPTDKYEISLENLSRHETWGRSWEYKEKENKPRPKVRKKIYSGNILDKILMDVEEDEKTIQPLEIK